jgi:hypothetical protein
MPNVIPVPKPSQAAYNPGRPLEKNTLVQALVQHFKAADANLPESFRTGMDTTKIATEGEASEYIRKVTRAIHESGGRAPEKVRVAE